MKARPALTPEQSDHCLELLIEMVEQNCKNPHTENRYFSGFISTHADAIEFLCEIGLMHPVYERCCRDIEAIFIP